MHDLSKCLDKFAKLFYNHSPTHTFLGTIMNIDFDNLARLIKLTETAQIHSLEIQDGTQTIKLTKYPSDTPPAPVGHIAPVPTADTAPTRATQTPDNPSAKHTITSPMLGTFYRKSAPDSPNFVEVGDTIKAGDTLCIVEAMKIMHEVKAGTDGVVAEILVEEGDMVEYDAPLFVIDNK
ncbi:Biotin carboxyl carrier protein of acetyl-CoA carboxylase [Moraxella lacunata]|uniref:Biotin carboxyl carrier protein of acetyl-CoA carboxylase n=2 Tax=Moraxella lacunata TaxID=477 RepID=A0A378QJT8_MORLA|nr:Biotin carboxyl carrier protein of acetyl-CoA carboxylase [Moraxella lacunata]